MSKNLNLIITTGASRGIGNAISERIYENLDDDTRLICLGRSKPDFLGDANGRAQHVSLDFLDESCVTGSIQGIRDIIEDAASISLVHVAGIAQLSRKDGVDRDTQLKEMIQVNCDTPIGITEEILRITDKLNNILYASTASIHKNATSGAGLEGYCESKKLAEEKFKNLLDKHKLILMQLGKYATDMTGTVNQDDVLPLEWLSVLGADPKAKNGIADLVSDIVLDRKSFERDILIRPRLIQYLLNNLSPEMQMKLMPQFIKSTAKYILQIEMGLPDEKAEELYDDNLIYLAENNSYGKDFPYDSVRFSKLNDIWLGKLQKQVLGAVKLSR